MSQCDSTRTITQFDHSTYSSPVSARRRSTAQGKNVQFSNVVVYSFAREQGFSAIPDSGWCSLGMASTHCDVARFDVHHHQLLVRLRKRHRMRPPRSGLHPVQKAHLRASGFASRGRNKKKFITSSFNHLENRTNPGDSTRVPVFTSPPPLSPQVNANDEASESTPDDAAFNGSHSTPPPPCLSPPSPRRVWTQFGEATCTQNVVSFPDSLDTDSEASLDHTPAVSSSTAVRTRHRKLLPVHGPARIRLLKESGVTWLDESERDICLQIRAARSRVGCDCNTGSACTPDKCSCIENGIQCQVDRASFPCSCTAESCRNPNGRTEFSHERVRAHVLSVLKAVNEKPPLSCKPCLQTSGDNPPDFVASLDQKRVSSTVKTPVESNDCSTQSDSPGENHCTPHFRLKKFTAMKQFTSNDLPPGSQLSTVNSMEWISSTPDRDEFTTRRVLFVDAESPVLTTSNDWISPDAVVSTESQYPQTVAHAPNSTNPVSSTDSVPVQPRLAIRDGSQLVRSLTPCCPTFSKSKSDDALPYASNINKSSYRNVVDCSFQDQPVGSIRELADVCVGPLSSLDNLPTEVDVGGRTSSPSEQWAPKSAPLTPVRARQRATILSGDFKRFPLQSNENVDIPLPFTTPTSFRSSGRFISKSAPSSPCPNAQSSLNRLSLRRRAIPRSPGTPFRRVPKSPRSRNWNHPVHHLETPMETVENSSEDTLGQSASVNPRS